MSNKVCGKCGQEKPIEEFYDDKRSQCKECERIAANNRMKRSGNRMKAALRYANQTAEKYEVRSDLTLDDIRYLYEISDSCCAYCGVKTDEIQLEHIQPLSRNGANTLANVTLSCNTCNKRKGDRALLSEVEMGRMDPQAILDLIDKIAYRAGISVIEVHEMLHNQQRQYNREDLQKYFERKRMRKEGGCG